MIDNYKDMIDNHADPSYPGEDELDKQAYEKSLRTNNLSDDAKVRALRYKEKHGL